jgi:predicted Rossmann fold nucleotide-binding protein DprA/Smf involved in DNA uptake
VGNRSLLIGGGLGIVGSRNIDQKGEAFTRQVAVLCACNQMPVVSGGARGVDQISMTSALEAGGAVIGLLAENLLKKSVERKNREAIAENRLLLISPYHPNARFSVGSAMGRNKLIYAMADYALVVSSDYNKGGTWAGATEELKRDNPRPVFVRVGSNVPEGNNKLLKLGAIKWPEITEKNKLKEKLAETAVSDNIPEGKIEQPSLFDIDSFNTPSDARINQDNHPPSEKADIEKKAQDDNLSENPSCTFASSNNPTSIYEAVLPVILKQLETAMSSNELAKELEVNKNQLNAWLKKAVNDGMVNKLSKPVRYQRIKDNLKCIT